MTASFTPSGPTQPHFSMTSSTLGLSLNMPNSALALSWTISL
jgi:hypothetical protein